MTSNNRAQDGITILQLVLDILGKEPEPDDTPETERAVDRRYPVSDYADQVLRYRGMMKRKQ